ncbi:unnamed protein product, partial [Mesorhabditis belari]|uniref:Uncharacterized protein n=1 Tax=Mesorhabditis belari TaxID=2138241 RepID=A0AAF3FUB6_9BILA
MEYRKISIQGIQKLQECMLVDVKEAEWKEIGNKMFRDGKVLEKEWKEMCEELNEEMDAGRSLEEALDVVAPKCERVSASQIATFIDIALNLCFVYWLVCCEVFQKQMSHKSFDKPHFVNYDLNEA